MPRRRFQNGQVYLRGKRWVGTFREYEPNPATGKRTRRKITFDESVTSKRAAEAALKPYLDDYNAKAKADERAKPAPPKSGKTVSVIIQEWQEKIHCQTINLGEHVRRSRMSEGTFSRCLESFTCKT